MIKHMVSKTRRKRTIADIFCRDRRHQEAADWSELAIRLRTLEAGDPRKVAFLSRGQVAAEVGGRP